MSDCTIWSEFGNIYFKIGSYEEAIAAYNRAIDLAPEAGWPISNLALVYFHQGKFDLAVQLFQKSIPLLDSRKQKSITWNRLGDAFRKLNDYYSAMAAYQMADDLAREIQEIKRVAKPEKLGKPNGNGSKLPIQNSTNGSQSTPLDASLSALESKLEKLERIAASRSTEPIHNRKTQSLPKPGQETSQAAADSGMRKNGSTPDIATTKQPSGELTSWLDGLLDKETASIEPEKSDQDSKDRMRSRSDRAATSNSTEVAVLEVRKKESEPAKSEVTVERAKPGESQDIEYQKTDPQESDGKDTGAQPAQTPNFTNTLTLDLRKEIAVYQKITNLAPANDRAWDTLGKMYQSLGQFEQAIEAYDKAIALAPYREVYHYHLGLAYAAQQRHNEAVETLKQVIELKPDFTLAHCALAGSYRRLGEDANADRHLQIVEEEMEIENEYNRACFEAIRGDTDKAISLLKTALENNLTHLEWIRSDPDLDFIREDPRFKAFINQDA